MSQAKSAHFQRARKLKVYNVLTLLYSHTLVEHRPSVFSFHRWRFLAWARSSPNDIFPHSRILISFWLFRRVCPIQPYFLRFISTSISDCPGFSHSSWLVIIRGHQIRRMFRRHLLTKAWSFCVVLFVTNKFRNHTAGPIWHRHWTT